MNGELFQSGVIKGAILSPCRTYRYRLWRHWGEPDGPKALFIGLNPSTADELDDDPTIRRCVNFAKAWGCDGMVMANLFAFRATSPEDMKAAIDPVGPDNDATILSLAGQCIRRVACWGVHGAFDGRDKVVFRMLDWLPGGLSCLGVTKGGMPKHPLYLPKSATLEQYFGF